ncbi:MAG: FKBP-type peptidyl-prolyl cis-trans isomerase [Bacteroidales bacterium]
MHVKAYTWFFPLWLTSLLVLMMACDTETPEQRAEKDREKILEYLEEHGYDYEELDSGVFVVIEEEGSGNYPNENSTIRMTFEGYELNGDLYNAGYNTNVQVTSMVPGFRYGITSFKRDGSGMIFIPSDLGYGENGYGNLPYGEVLRYEVEIFDF